MAVTSICPGANSHSAAPTHVRAVPHGNIVAYTDVNGDANGYAAAHSNIVAYTDINADANGYTAAHGDTTTGSNSNSTAYSFAH